MFNGIPTTAHIKGSGMFLTSIKMIEPILQIKKLILYDKYDEMLYQSRSNTLSERCFNDIVEHLDSSILNL